MNKHEFQKIADAIRTYYPRENPFPNSEAMQLWYQEFAEMTYEDVVCGLRRHVNTSRWCPTIAELKEAIVSNVAGERDWGESWNECLNAISKYGQYREAEALANMTPITRLVVTRIGYKELCRSEDITLDRANYRKIYAQVTTNEYERAALPVSLQKQIASIGNLPMLEEEAR